MLLRQATFLFKMSRAPVTRSTAALYPGLTRHLAARPLVAARPARPARLRCLASKAGDEKSWGEIASEAVSVGKDLLKKVGSTVSKTVDAIVSSEKRESEPLTRRERRREEVEYPSAGGGLLGGLVGRAVGGMVGGMIREVGKMAAQAAQQVADVQSRAAAIIETSEQVRGRLGAVRVGPPFSQSSATSSINGRTTRRVTLLLPVDSSRGRATAEVSFVEGDAAPAGGSDFNIRLRLPSGQVLTLDNASTSYAGKTIDVEWRSID